MYIHIGKNVLLNEKNILGIFDMETTTVSHITRDYLAQIQKKRRIVNIFDEIPKTFVVYCEDGQITVYLTQFSTNTILKRKTELF